MIREKPVMLEEDYLLKLEEKGLAPDGYNLLPDPTPIAPPLGYIKQPSITERIRDMVRSEHLRREAEAAGAETFEEANDFDVGDDYDPNSPYEEVYEPPVGPAVSSTGVPSPGGGEGAGGLSGGSPAPNPAPVPPAPPAGPPAAGGAPSSSTSTST